jgi:hypothetical protein
MNPDEIEDPVEVTQEEIIFTDAYSIDAGSIEETTDIPDIHRGTVDNPFLYNASIAELENFILINMFVAGKNASVQQLKLDQFVNCVRRDLGSDIVDKLGVLSAIHNCIPSADINDFILGLLKEVKAGQYTRLTAGVVQLSEAVGSGKINLRACTRTELVKIKGIGYKTASMFLMYTRRNLNIACLDTHILKYLREEANVQDVPLATPSTVSEYRRLEREFINLAQKANKSISDFDFEIWSYYRKKASKPDAVTIQEEVTASAVDAASSFVEC